MNTDQLKQFFSTRTPSVLGSDKLSAFSLLVPLVQKPDGFHVLFEVRAFSMRRQPGEICFPGGKIDKSDPTSAFTAVRETQEELGVPPEHIELLFDLDYMITPFDTIVYSHAGIIDVSAARLNEAEVDHVFTVPLDFLLAADPALHSITFRPELDEDFPYHLIAGGDSYSWPLKKTEEYFYVYDGRIIWGLTARILKHFLDLLRSVPHLLDK